MRLRALWRLERNDLSRALEARALLDTLIPLTHLVVDVVLRARVTAAAGDPELALRTLHWVVSRLDVSYPHNALFLDPVAQALDAIPEDGDHAKLRREVESALLTRRLEFRGLAP